MLTGTFDPWAAAEAAVGDEEERRLREEAAAKRNGRKSGKRVMHNSSPEDKAALRAAVEREDETLEERTEERLWGFWTEREERFAEDLGVLWEEAVWMMDGNLGFHGHFPDGKPMREQVSVKLSVWGVLRSAMSRRAVKGSGGTGGGGDDRDAARDDHEHQERYPAPPDATE